jgi:formylglycine-generating enzyme required for sulfatase activity
MQIKKTILLTTLIPSISLAAPLDPPAPPDDIGSAMYSIWDICKRLETGAAGEKRTFQAASSGPASTGCSLNDIMNKAPAKSAMGVSPNEVPAGKEYWGLTNGNWGLQTGTAPSHGAKTYVPQAADQGIAAGYYQAGVVKGDANLKPENIRAGVMIFGVVGTYTPEPQTLPAGSTFRDTLTDGSFGPEMVVIPAGTFRMGDIQGGGSSDEQPVHEVYVGQFAMGKFEVTFAEYDKFAEADGREKPDDRGWGRGNRPVMNVTWYDATAYTEWLSNQTGKQYRLPTEAQWEYAARAGTETKYWWGNEIGENKANCYANYCGDSFEYTSDVGSFAANQFGLYDTSGNLWEWTCSEYENPYNGKESKCNNNANKYISLSLRGGSWDNLVRNVRSADRDRDTPPTRNYNIGFRISRLEPFEL